MQLIHSLGVNQFVINGAYGEAFQSYSSLIAYRKNNFIYLSDKWDYSKTTLKYLKIFLNTSISKKEIKEALKRGVFQLITEKEIAHLLFR